MVLKQFRQANCTCDFTIRQVKVAPNKTWLEEKCRWAKYITYYKRRKKYIFPLIYANSKSRVVQSSLDNIAVAPLHAACIALYIPKYQTKPITKKIKIRIEQVVHTESSLSYSGCQEHSITHKTIQFMLKKSTTPSILKYVLLLTFKS